MSIVRDGNKISPLMIFMAAPVERSVEFFVLFYDSAYCRGEILARRNSS